MQKKLIKWTKIHYGYRWTIMRYNQKHNEKHGSLHDAIIMKYLVPGTTLTFDCIGHQYQGLIPNLSVDQEGIYDNILMLNTMKLKYRSLEELQCIVVETAQQCRQRMFVGFNFQFVQFNRFKFNFLVDIEDWINQLANKGIVLYKNLSTDVPKTTPYGDCLFIFDIKK